MFTPVCFTKADKICFHCINKKLAQLKPKVMITLGGNIVKARLVSDLVS